MRMQRGWRLGANPGLHPILQMARGLERLLPLIEQD